MYLEYRSPPVMKGGDIDLHCEDEKLLRPIGVSSAEFRVAYDLWMLACGLLLREIKAAVLYCGLLLCQESDCIK